MLDHTQAMGMVLLAALLHAAWNSLVKGGNDKFLTVVAVAMSSTFVAIISLVFFPSLTNEAWPYITFSLFLHTAYSCFLAQSYKYGDLSFVYPIARGIAPLLVAFLSYFFAGEILDLREIVGIALISIGIMSITFTSRGKGAVDSKKAIFFSLGTGCFIASYTIVDGIGARVSGEPLAYGAWLFAFIGWPLLAIALVVRGKEAVLKGFAECFKSGIIGGSCSLVAYVLVIWALSFNTMASVSALRETSVIIGSVIGVYFFKESLGRWRITAAALVTIGVLVMNFQKEPIFQEDVPMGQKLVEDEVFEGELLSIHEHS
ncbi:MAG: drug/metabolite transporter (DMT)-like permease [Chlamydiales bacterium]